MAAEAKKNWGTIFMGSGREISLDQLPDAAAGGGRKGIWSRSLEEEYLERVQRRAGREARDFLARAEKERIALLEAAKEEAARMLEEARRESASLRAEADRQKTVAEALMEEARAARAAAEEKGYDAGIERARGDLENFREVMGESAGAVLGAVHGQRGRIFTSWKEELCALVPLCVEKGLAWILDEERKRVLENLFPQAARLLDGNSVVVVRVHPDDEAFAADILAAAREHGGSFGRWSARGDPALAPGDLVLESPDSRVESRLAERKAAVDAALRHLTLPSAPEEEKGEEEATRASARAVARMLELASERRARTSLLPLPVVPPVVLPVMPEDGSGEAPESESGEDGDGARAADCAAGEHERAAQIPEDGESGEADAEAARLEGVAPPRVDLHVVWGKPAGGETGAGAPSGESAGAAAESGLAIPSGAEPGETR
jgi:flagellar assembly protein FliH